MDETAQNPVPEAPQTQATPVAQVPIGEPTRPKTSRKKMLIIAAVVGLVAIIALTGTLVVLQSSQKKKVVPEEKVVPSATPTISATTSVAPSIPEEPAPVMQFLPSKQYYNDTISIITTDNPHLVLALSATRSEQEASFLQYTAVSYFDGTTWSRDTITNTNTKSQVTNNTVIRNWSSSLGSAKPEEGDLSITATVKNVPISIMSGKTKSEISLLSLPSYTKLAYQGTGIVTIDGIEHEAHYIYTRAYSLNAASLAFLNTPEQYSSKWLALWDDLKNFYLYEALESKGVSSQPLKYTFAAKQSETGVLTKITKFDLSQNDKDSGRFNLTLGSQKFDYAYLNSVSKAPVGARYVWTVGTVDGSTVIPAEDPKNVRNVYTLGIFEDIHPIER